MKKTEASMNFFDWELSDYRPKPRIKLFAYKEDIRSRQASFHRIQRLDTHMPFILGFSLA